MAWSTSFQIRAPKIAIGIVKNINVNNISHSYFALLQKIIIVNIAKQSSQASL